MVPNILEKLNTWLLSITSDDIFMIIVRKELASYLQLNEIFTVSFTYNENAILTS